LSTEEIEDVVSSVRRLVSNEQNARRTSRDLGAERLILTPSLRVVSELSPLAPLVLDERIAEAPETESHPPEEVLEVEPDDTAVELIEAEWEDEIWTEPEVVSLGEVALAAEEAEVLASPAAAEEPEVAAEAPTVEAESSEAWRAEWTDEEPVPFIPLRRRAEDLAARLAAGDVLETDDGDDEMAEEEAAAEPAPAVAPDVAPELLEDDPELSAFEEDVAVAKGQDAALSDAAAPRLPTEIIDADGTPLAVLDEAALQEIVRQMIREELQGALGERITRNVRKLVRAVINRALIARDLD
jgi:hypothetical protein